MTEPTLTQRACERIRGCARAEEHYRESLDDSCMIRDMLTDIRHFCDTEGVDLFRAIDASYEVYLVEKLDGDEGGNKDDDPSVSPKAEQRFYQGAGLAPSDDRYLEAARAKYMGDSGIEVVDVDDTDAVDGAWVNARIFVRDDEVESAPGPTYDVWIGEQEELGQAPGGFFLGGNWNWTIDVSFSCDDDSDGKGARLSAHKHARNLRNIYPCALVAVRPSGKAPLPIKHS